jgi:hypothetical protein
MFWVRSLGLEDQWLEKLNGGSWTPQICDKRECRFQTCWGKVRRQFDSEKTVIRATLNFHRYMNDGYRISGR